MSIYWLIIFVILVGIEMSTMALTTIWFAGGSILGFILSLFGAPVELQLAAFLAVSFILLFLTRPFVARYVNHSTVRTNIDSLIGRTARVTREINNNLGTGAAMLGGQEWTARAYDGEAVYEAGAIVVVREIRGVKLIVSEYAADNDPAGGGQQKDQDP